MQNYNFQFLVVKYTVWDAIANPPASAANPGWDMSNPIRTYAEAWGYTTENRVDKICVPLPENAASFKNWPQLGAWGAKEQAKN